MRGMVRGMCVRKGEEVFKGVIRHMLLTFAQKRSCSRKQCMCVPVPKYVFKFSAVSFCRTHLTDNFWVGMFSSGFCSLPGMLLWCRSLCFLLLFFFKCIRQVVAVGGWKAAPCLEVQVQSKMSVKGGMRLTRPPAHTLPPSRLEMQPHKWKSLLLPSAFLGFLASFSLPYFLPELHTNPEWARAAPPVFKHLARSLVSSFLQLIQEADKYC